MDHVVTFESGATMHTILTNSIERFSWESRGEEGCIHTYNKERYEVPYEIMKKVRDIWIKYYDVD